MSLQEFKFKNFKLIHGDKGLKVNTDGVLLGAWAGSDENIESALDIGTGVGLIALILAQRFKNAHIDAIDINKEVIELAETNFKNSPWKERLVGFKKALNNFNPDKTYDLIVSNPPFFENSLKPENEIRRETKHIESLHISDIFSFAQQNLNSKGSLNMIYPERELEKMLLESEKFGFTPNRITKVYPKRELPSKRVLISFKRGINNKLDQDSLILENEARHDYHESYKNLCKDLYLKF